MSDEPRKLTTAHEHALFASELLNGAQAFSRRLENLTPDERLHAAVTGGIKAANEDLQWTCQLAHAHAVTALALGFTTPGGWEAA